jgi:hypothetical protein
VDRILFQDICRRIRIDCFILNESGGKYFWMKIIAQASMSSQNFTGYAGQEGDLVATTSLPVD